MNWLDFVIIAIIVWFTFAGLNAGVLREAVGLTAAVLGVVLAGQFYQRLADDVKIAYDNQNVDRLVAFSSIFAASILAGQIIGGFFKDAATMLRLGPVDSILGFVFGALKGCVIVELLLLGFAAFPAVDRMTSAMASSLLVPVFLGDVPWLLHLLPGLFRNAAHGF